MAVIFRYELKKLFSSKLLWALLALCAGISVFADWYTLEDRFSGRVQGLRDIYGQYEGQVVTDAFKSQVQADFERYIAAHPEHFTAYMNDEDGTVTYFSNDSGFYNGVWNAYNDIGNTTSIEMLQDSIQYAQEALKRGANEDGSPLLFYQKKDCEEMARRKYETPVLYYAEGWRTLYNTGSPIPGTFTLLLTALWLLPLFNRESTARMEGVLLCSAKRGRTAIAKMLAAACTAVGTCLLFFGIKFLFVTLAYELDGASLPLSAVYWWEVGSMPVGAAFSLAALALLLAAMAVASLVALSSALFRRPVAALLCAAAMVALPFLLRAVYDSGYVIGLHPLQSPIAYDLYDYVWRLPSLALFEYNTLFDGVTGFRFIAFSIAFPALLAGLACWLALRQFLKQRKA